VANKESPSENVDPPDGKADAVSDGGPITKTGPNPVTGCQAGGTAGYRFFP
jgi:hypothetical protein